MKHIKSLGFIYIIKILVLAFMPMISFAQDPGPGPDVEAPIDGGVLILVAAGIAYGVKGLKQEKLKRKLESKKIDNSQNI